MATTDILVTGFGPFGNHSINASWEAVKLLENRTYNVYNITVCEIPVEYQYIDEYIPELWKKFKPKLVMHVGVSHLATDFTIECYANRDGYCKPDATGVIHKTGQCRDVDEATCVLQPEIAVHVLCNKFNSCDHGLHASLSENAGRFLCEYTFFKSLSIDCSRTLFVHVPMLNSPYSAQQLADGLFCILGLAIDQLDAIDCCVKQCFK